MGTFDVFVEGPTDASPDATRRLAEVMSQRYGLPATELMARMAKGRFRVKGNIDQATANTYARDLEAIGARVTIAEARATGGVAVAEHARASNVSLPPATVSPNVVQRSGAAPRSGGSSLPPATAPSTARAGGSSLPPATAPSTARAGGSSLPPATGPSTARSGGSSRPPATAPSTARAGGSVLPPATGPSTARTGGSSLPPANTASTPRAPASSLPPANRPNVTTPPFASGLAAAFSEEHPAANLGALEEGSLSLAALDGTDDVPPPKVSFSPPADAPMPASIGPASRPTPTPKPQRPKDIPLDLFAPPGSEEAELRVELAPDEIAHREQRKRVSTPPAMQAVPTPTPPSTPVLQRRSAMSLAPATKEPMLGVVAAGPPRWRFAAGVFVAIVLGFVPAHIVAGAREASAYKKIDNQIDEVQSHVGERDAPIAYDKLDSYRDHQQDQKKSDRRSIAIVSMLIWALAGAGIAFAWFRLIPWDKKRS